MVKITPLEKWLSRKIGVATLTLPVLRQYQLAALIQNFNYARGRSKFYGELYQGLAVPQTWLDFANLPFISQADLKNSGTRMLCVEQDEIERIVTLDTSGTLGKAKRVYFTKADQELTVDFFAEGMPTLAASKDRVLILLPCKRPGSVGDLLATGLRRFGAVPLTYGVASSCQEVVDFLAANPVEVIVANPRQLLAIGELAKLNAIEIKLRSVLLSADYVAAALIKRLEQLFDCPIFEHYGMTETGLGGGVSCEALEGYHLREADLYFEIIDPQSGRVLPWGEWGEVVFSTLTRQAMPLLRYRTGDFGAFLKEPCPCGSVLPRLAKVEHRLDLSQFFKITDFDEELFRIKQLVDYELVVCQEAQQMELQVFYWAEQPSKVEILACLAKLAPNYQLKIKMVQGISDAQFALRKRKIKIVATNLEGVTDDENRTKNY